MKSSLQVVVRGAVGAARLVAAAALWCATPAWATVLIGAGTPVAGVSQQLLAQQYATWLIAESGLVAFDQTLVNTINASPVVFLPVTYEPVATYNLTVVGQVPLFFPVLTVSTWFDNDQSTDGPPCDTAVNRFQCWQDDIAAFLDNPSSLTLQVDGIDIPVSDAHRRNSGGVAFDVTIGANAYGTPPGVYNGLFDGWWTALAPLSPGQHKVVYGFDYGGVGVLQTANISVVPVAPTVWLVGLALLSLAAQRRRPGAPANPTQNPSAAW